MPKSIRDNMRPRGATKTSTRCVRSASSSAPKGAQSLIQGLRVVNPADTSPGTTSIPRCAFTFRTPQAQPDHVESHATSKMAFTDIPLDIIFILMKALAERLDNCSAVCLGLTCRTYYRV